MRAVLTGHDDPEMRFVAGSEVMEIVSYPGRWDVRNSQGHSHAVVVRIAGGRTIHTYTDRIEVQP